MTEDARLDADHETLLNAVESAIASTIAIIRKNGGTTSQWSMLIFAPEELQGPEGGWGEKLMSNGRVVLQMPSSELAPTLARYWDIDVGDEGRKALSKPNPEGALRCVTVVRRTARHVDVQVPTLAHGGNA